jgi:uncharacterized membrane protein
LTKKQQFIILILTVSYDKTKELVGMVVSFITCFVFRPPIWTCFLLMIPMVVDGTVQMFTKYESNNRRRFITGFLFGYGFFMIFVIMTVVVWGLGVEYGKTLREK